jgi:4-amino-4-deoxy-L-arabinose transferase-like glycosyltransferase
MIVTSTLPWFVMLAVILLASTAGFTLSRLMPWSSAARLAGVPQTFGFALGPFLLGAASVLVLGLLPGSSHKIHLILVITFLTVIVLAAWRYGALFKQKSTRKKRIFGEYLLAVLLALWLLMLFINSIFLPLTQNDALEYASVGKILYETRDLNSYPAIDPEKSASGFFGPWTHPPLYVSLIYLMQVIQGNADEPGFMRLIAPWFVVCGTFLVFALGSLVSRLTGRISAVIFLSTPLLFLGADSALIDALPVLGICLVVTAILCLKAKPYVWGALVGAALALALWTHSQAVLFLPLALGAMAMQNGVRGLRLTMQASARLVGVAFLFGSWPYWRNLQIFGSPVSDNPAVFALRSLDWPSYFATARGLDNWVATIQYGLLKGWFSFEAYGWTFWLMTFGVAIAFKNFRRPSLRAIIFAGGRSTLDSGSQVLWVSLLLVVGYLCGVLVSVMTGLDLMIKNERYMLVILPFVAILAGYGSNMLLGRGARIIGTAGNSQFKRDFLVFSAVALVLLLLIQLFLIGWFYRWRQVPPSVEITDADNVTEISKKSRELEKPRFKRLLANFPNISVMFWVDEQLPPNSLVLSLRPADMYYAHRKMISYLDERLLPLYVETVPQRASEILRDLGVTHLHVPDYGLPVTYNSVLDRIIEDPAFSRLIHSNEGTQIFRLLTPEKNKSIPVASDGMDFTPVKSDWSQYLQLNLGGRKALSALGVGGKKLTQDGLSVMQMDVSIFHRDFSTMVLNGVGTPLTGLKFDTGLAIRGEQEYKVVFDLEGEAFIKVWMIQFDASGRIIKRTENSSGVVRIAELVLDRSGSTKRISRRFLTRHDAAYVRFGIEHVGHSTVTIKKALLESVPTYRP